MKLHIKIAVLLVTVAVIVGVFNVYWSGVKIQRILQQNLVVRATTISQNILSENESLLERNDYPPVSANLQHLVSSEGGIDYVFITNPADTVLASSFGQDMPAALKHLELPDIQAKLHPIIIPLNAFPMSVLHIAFPIKHPIDGFLHIGVNSNAMMAEVASLRNQEVLFMVLAAVMAVILGVFLVKRVTQPIEQLAEQLRSYSQGGEVPKAILNEHGGSSEANLLSAAFKQLLDTRLHMEQTLSRQKAEFEAIFNSMGDAVVFADVDRKIRLCNPAMEKMFGYQCNELVGDTTERFYADPADFKMQGKIRYRAGEVVHVEPYEMRYRRKDGSVFYSETSGAQVRDDNGNIMGFVALFRDLTEERRRNQELRNFKNTLDATLDCVFMFWPDTLKFFYVNKGASEQVGYTEEEMLGMTPVDIKPEYDEPGFRELLKPLHDGNRKAITFETVHQHKNGQRVPVEIFLQYVSQSDDPPRYVAIVRDITERRRAEKELHEQHQLLMLVINNVPLVLWAIDKEGVFNLSLGKGLENLGLKPGQVVGQSALEFYAGNEQIVEDLHRALKGESFLSSINVADRFFEVFYSPFYDAENNLVGTTGVAVDVTDRHQAENELRNYRDLLEERVAQRTQELATAVKELEAFSYSVSHDLRSPLRSIDGFSHILMDDYASGLDATALGYLGKIRSAAQRMAQLIDDLLQLSRVTRSELFLEPVNISELAGSIVQEFKAADPERKAEVTIQPGLWAQADMNLIRIMLQNLFANAWKYTGKQKLTKVTLGQLDSPDANVFYIRDNGTGFDMKYAGKLFGAFQRLHHGDEYEGTGIGLATVQRIIDRHGGKVWAESELGKGATFYFQLPAVSSSVKG